MVKTGVIKVNTPVTITRDEWLKALAVAEEVTNDPNAFTIQELADLTDRSIRTITPRIRQLLKEGRVVRTVKRVPRAQGGTYPTPAYILKSGVASLLKP